MSLSSEDADKIADAVMTRVEVHKKSFWIEPEPHYLDHVQRREWKIDDYNDLNTLLRLFQTTRGVFGKFFIGLVIVGGVALATYGAVAKFGGTSTS